MRGIRAISMGVIINAITAWLAVAQGVAPEGSIKPEASFATEIGNYLDSVVAENRLSGAVLVAKDGVTIASKVAGIANKKTGAPIELSTKFNLGSMNKMFTAVAVAQLAQAGRLAFEDRLGKHLPDYPNKEVADKVTIHHLLTHTSGMGLYWNEKFNAQREKLVTVAAHLPLFAGDPLSSVPGEKFRYSNSGYMVLGAIIEKVSGQDYYSYVQEHVYKPAGMTETGFYEPGKEIANLAIGYTNTGSDGKLLLESKDNSDTREVKGGPAGGGYSTVGDIMKFQLALRSHKLLNQKFTELVTTGKVDGPRGLRYGYGFGTSEQSGKRVVGHNGGAPGIAASFEMYPDSGYTAVVLMNSDPSMMTSIVKGIRQRIPAK